MYQEAQVVRCLQGKHAKRLQPRHLITNRPTSQNRKCRQHNAERQGTTTGRKTTMRTTKMRKIRRMRDATMGTTTKQLGNMDDRDNRKQDPTRIAKGGNRHENHKDNGPDSENSEYSKDREDQEWGGEGEHDPGRSTAGTGTMGHRQRPRGSREGEGRGEDEENTCPTRRLAEEQGGMPFHI